MDQVETISAPEWGLPSKQDTDINVRLFEMETLLSSKEILKIKNWGLPSKEEFIRKLGHFDVDFSNGGNSTEIIGNMKFSDFVSYEMEDGDTNYVFHDIFTDRQVLDVVEEMVPIPFTHRKFRISRLYLGAKGTGTNLHNHSVAINYLISGKKLWVVFPNSPWNQNFIREHNCRYGKLQTSTLEWWKENEGVLRNEIHDIKIIEQESGEALLVPHFYYHAIINLEPSIGFTYSWY